MSGITWLALLVLLIASYLSTLHLSLLRVSASALHRRLSAKGKQDAGTWVLDRRRACGLASSLLRTIGRLAFFVLILVDTVGVGPDSSLTVNVLLTTTAIAVAALWLCSSVIASAVARFAGTGVLATSLPLLQVLIVLGTPLAKVLWLLDEIVRRLTGANLNESGEMEADLLRQIEDSQLQGDLDAGAAELLENVVDFRSTDVAEVMTPRTDIDGIALTNDLVEIRKMIVEMGHSRIPVYEENLDHIVGILYVKDLVPYLGEDASDFSLQPLLRQPIRVPVTKIVHELLADFQNSEVHMAMVIDEYGGTAGLVTIEDVLEELVGEIKDEHDPDHEEEPSLTRIDPTHVEVDGRYHIDDLNEQLELGLPEGGDFDTVGGFVLAQLGRVPATGDSFESHNARFTALAASPTHVRKVGIELTGSLRINGDEEATKRRSDESPKERKRA